MYIIAGTFGKGSTGDNGTARTIAGGKVTVPAAMWKVIVVLPAGSDDVNRISAQARVIAVWTVGRCHTQRQYGRGAAQE